MKKYLFFACAAFLFVGKARAQDAVLFKPKYLPNHTYNSTMTMNMDMQMTEPGKIHSNTNKNVTKPQMKMHMETATDMKMITGSVDSSKAFPISMSVRPKKMRMVMNGKESNMPNTAHANQMIYGKATADGKLFIDSVAGIKLADSLKNKMVGLINNLMNAIKFPDHALKIGETFTQEIPINMPMGNLGGNLISKGTYKLISVKDNIAIFDILMNVSMNVAQKQMNMQMTGGGTGKLTYDIITNYPGSTKMDINLNYSLNEPTTHKKMKGAMKMLFDQQSTVLSD
jgi:hypothetical protein